jgi:hypothetical protein
MQNTLSSFWRGIGRNRPFHELTFVDKDKVIFNDKQYTRLTDKFDLALLVKTLSRSVTVVRGQPVEISVNGCMTPVGVFRIAMMDAPDFPATRFEFQLCSGESARWSTDVPSEDARDTWPARLSCGFDQNMSRPRNWFLSVDIDPAEIDTIISLMSVGCVENLSFSIALEGLFISQHKNASKNIAYMLPRDYWKPDKLNRPEVCGIVRSIEIVSEMFGLKPQTRRRIFTDS